jgi:maltooligosyltrehalose trehalohydrolase
MINHRTLGINFDNSGNARIKIWAPLVQTVDILFNSNNVIPLQKESFGYWQNNTSDLKPGDRYKILLNNKDSFPDPASLSQPGGVHEASECIDLNEIRKLSSGTWNGLALQDVILYELHVGTFSSEATFEGIASRLPYLKELGITAINIMPVAAFPGKRNWGYDGAYPFAVHNAYGGAKALARLVKQCHDQGLAVVLDVVYNHLGPEGNYLGAVAPYFTEKYKTPWGNAVNFDDAWCFGVREYFLENALMWLRDFNIDGLRLDAVHAIKDFSAKHFLKELTEKVEELNQKTGASHFLIAENDLNDERFIRDLQKDGYGLHAQWCDEWHHALHALLTGEKSGYYSDFGSIAALTKSFNNAYVFTGEYSEHRKKYFGTTTEGFWGDKFVVFTQNHDHTGNRMLGERLSQLISFEALKLAAGAMLLSPFIPLIFMGEEYAENNPFLYFIDHGDKDLVKAVQEGRKKEFKDFVGETAPPDPASEKTFNDSRVTFNYQTDNKRAAILNLYKTLIELRKTLPLLKPGDRSRTRATHHGNTIILTRENQRDKLIAVFNFSDTSTSVELPEEHTSRLLLYSAHQKWEGPVEDSAFNLNHSSNKTTIILEAKSFALLQIQPF